MTRKTLTEQYKETAGANQFLVAHCQKTLDDIRLGYQGASHAMNRCLAENADVLEAVKELRELQDSSEKRITEVEAEIGRFQEQVSLLEESLEKARGAYKELRGKVGK